MNQLTDEDLYSKLAIDPEKAFEVLYERHSGPLFRFIYRFTENKQFAEEILHDIFIQLLAGKFKQGNQSNLKSWLYTVAKNKSLNHIKKTSFVTANEQKIETELYRSDLESKVLGEIQLSRLSLAEATLPSDLRETWLLRKNGFDYQQIAAKLSIPLGTVKSRFHRLVEHLKEEFNNEQ